MMVDCLSPLPQAEGVGGGDCPLGAGLAESPHPSPSPEEVGL
jgi:hypothetical protein